MKDKKNDVKNKILDMIEKVTIIIGFFAIAMIMGLGIYTHTKESEILPSQYTYMQADIVNTVYDDGDVYYIVAVESGDEDLPENRFEIKVDKPIYKVGDVISVKTYDGKYYLDDEK